MKKKSIENKGKLFIIIIFIMFSLNIFLLSRIQNQTIAHFSDDFIENGEQKKPNTSASQSYTNEEWFKNTNFSSGINPWFNTTEIDSTDVKASNSSGQADFLVMGKELNFTYTANFSKPGEWEAKNNPYFNAFPEWPDSRGAGGNDKYGITPNGFWAQHNWSEGPRQEPSIQWVHDVELPVNISDYEIISASVLATVNATVDRNIDVIHPSDSPEGAIPSSPQGDIYDYAHFYVRIVEPNYDPVLDPPREIAWNKTKNLGLANDTEPLYYLEMENTNMNTLSQQDLIDDLSSVLSKDDQNFTIILGIDIHSEDNCNSDMDFWNSTLINYFSLNFTYRKKINQFASVSWSQKGNMINFTHIPYYSYVRIDDARLNFKYKIDQTWPSESFNSEIKFLINNVSQTEYPYTKLRSYNHTKLQGNFTEVISGGYDVADYIPIEKNISLTIQVLMLDEFNLDHLINISIDDVYFVISYTVFYNPPAPAADDDDDKTKTTFIEEPWFNVLIAIAAIAGAVCLGGYLVAYQLYLKYPKPVRKVRKYRRTLKRKKLPSVDITSRKKAFNSRYKEFSAISLLKGKPIEEKPSAKKINKSPEKLPK